MAKHEFSDQELAKLLDDTAKRAADAAVQALRSQAPPAGIPGDDDPDAQFREIMAKRRGHDRPAPADTPFAVKSFETGATFTAVVSRGRVVRLDEYKYPSGIDVSVDDGGLVPHGYIVRDVGTGQYTVLYKQWRYSEFWQRDLRAFVGKPLPPHAIVASAPTASQAAE